MNTNLLLEELQARHDFPVAEFSRFLALFQQKSLTKNEIVFQAGDVIQYTYFVLKGCLRQYYVNENGAENIIYFAEEGWWTSEMTSFLHQVPTTMNLQALEDCEVLALNRDNWEYATRHIPDFAIYQVKNRARTITMFKEQLAMRQTDTPDTRYRQLLKDKPQLLQRLPQYLVANYLGVTPETLSRIRKRNTRL